MHCCTMVPAFHVGASKSMSRQGEVIKLALWLCRWFVLKQGKIFWFKSDIVTPVRPHSAHR